MSWSRFFFPEKSLILKFYLPLYYISETDEPLQQVALHCSKQTKRSLTDHFEYRGQARLQAAVLEWKLLLIELGNTNVIEFLWFKPDFREWNCFEVQAIWPSIFFPDLLQAPLKSLRIFPSPYTLKGEHELALHRISPSSVFFGIIIPETKICVFFSWSPTSGGAGGRVAWGGDIVMSC